MNHSFRRAQADAQWTFLESLNPTLALLQEAPMRTGYDNIIQREVAGRPGLVTSIAGYDGVVLAEIPTVPLGEDLPRGYLATSHPGSFVVADVTIGSGTLTAISIYGLMASAFTKVVYATTSVQRMLSDLTPILDVNRSGAAVVIAGDLNITPQVPHPDTRAHAAIIDRVKAFGMIDCLGASYERYVRTLRHKNRPDSTPYQNDWMFASRKLKLISCRALDGEDAWELSDHCPLVAEFELLT